MFFDFQVEKILALGLIKIKFVNGQINDFREIAGNFNNKIDGAVIFCYHLT